MAGRRDWKDLWGFVTWAYDKNCNALSIKYVLTVWYKILFKRSVALQGLSSQSTELPVVVVDRCFHKNDLWTNDFQ